MLGLGLSLRSPRTIGTLVSPDPGGGDPQPVSLIELGDPGPSSTDDFQTEVFCVEVVDTGINEQTIYTYEVVVPGPTLDNITYDQIADKEETYQAQAGTNSNYTQGNISAITDTFNVAGGVKVPVPANENNPDEQIASVFQKFVDYLIQNPNVVSAVFGNTADQIGESGYTYFSSEPTSETNTDVTFHRYIFSSSVLGGWYNTLGILTSAFFDGLTPIEYLYSEQYPASIFTLVQALTDFSPGFPANVAFFRENIQVIDTSITEQPTIITLPPFGIIPTIAGFINAAPPVSSDGDTFLFDGPPVLGGTVPLAVAGSESLLIQFSIAEVYSEISGVPFQGNNLYPLGADENGDVDIDSFNTTFTIEYQDTDESTLSLSKTIAFTDYGSTHLVPNPADTTTFFKQYFYSGSISITQEEFPALFSGADNGALAVEVSIKNIFNSVPGDNNYAQSTTFIDPFPQGVYIPLVGVEVGDFITWLAGIEEELPGTSLNVLNSSDDTYNATPPSPSEQPTVISYSSTNKFKKKAVNFAGGKSADFAGTTAFTTTGTDFTFISITSSRASSTGTQLTVNRKTTTEGVGLDSGDIYVKLKNASLPTDTTPGTAPGAGIEDNLPIFNYMEKSGTNMSVYNEFNEETKRFTVGSSDLLEFNRITNAALNGAIAYIAVYDGVFTSVKKASLIEDLRIKYLDVNTINRHG